MPSRAKPTVPAAPGPYNVTAAAPFGPWASDSGVVYAGGAALTAVAAHPTAGQYNVSSGVYTLRRGRCRRQHTDFLRLYPGRHQQRLYRMGGRALPLPHPGRPKRADRVRPDNLVVQPQRYAGFHPRLARSVPQRGGLMMIQLAHVTRSGRLGGCSAAGHVPERLRDALSAKPTRSPPHCRRRSSKSCPARCSIRKAARWRARSQRPSTTPPRLCP